MSETKKIWTNHHKDSPSHWVGWYSKDSASEYIQERGGCYSLRVGETFDPKWVEEEEQFREEIARIESFF